MKRKPTPILLILLVAILLSVSVHYVSAQRIPNGSDLQDQKFNLVWADEEEETVSLHLLDELLQTQTKIKTGDWVLITISQTHFPVQTLYMDALTAYPEQTTQTYLNKLDEKGMVVESIQRLSDANQNLLRELVLSDGISRNSQTGSVSDFYPFPLDLNMGTVLRREAAYDMPATASLEEGTLNGQPVYIYTAKDEFLAPVAVGDIQATAARAVSWFDKSTGLIIKAENFVTKEDGTEIQISAYQYEFDLDAKSPLESLNR